MNRKNLARQRARMTGENYQRALSEIDQLRPDESLIPAGNATQRRLESALMQRLLRGPGSPLPVEMVSPSAAGLDLVVPRNAATAFAASLDVRPPGDSLMARQAKRHGRLVLTIADRAGGVIIVRCSWSELHRGQDLSGASAGLHFRRGRGPRLSATEMALLSALLRRINLFAEPEALDWLSNWHEWALGSRTEPMPGPPVALIPELTDTLTGLPPDLLDVLEINEQQRTMTRKMPEAVALMRGGRRLSYEVFGAPDGYPVFLLHGTPGSRIGPRPRGSVLSRLGVRLISYDRPGYGRSDRSIGRSVADAAADVEGIANLLWLDTFAVVGRSGGGPHALACAALLSSRVTRAAVLNPMAPEAEAGELSDEQTAGSDEPSVHGDRRSLRDTSPEASRTSPHGFLDDVRALHRPWGFRLADIHQPVLLRHDSEKNASPISHTRWLADRIPTAQLQMRTEPARFNAVDSLPSVLEWLIPESALLATPAATVSPR
ncbi:alpha/beta fold hydrolase [Micromonospora sp. RP3T]|uniref:alpha/beta fold hydrolase n=1 Tax=Micromonospora sp. RP3T TaxID=2135446 RepID=UPI003D765CEC